MSAVYYHQWTPGVRMNRWKSPKVCSVNPSNKGSLTVFTICFMFQCGLLQQLLWMSAISNIVYYLLPYDRSQFRFFYFGFNAFCAFQIQNIVWTLISQIDCNCINRCYYRFTKEKNLSFISINYVAISCYINLKFIMTFIQWLFLCFYYVAIFLIF